MRSNTEQYEHMKKELEKMTFENERLQRRKNELELIVEQTKLKENIGITNGEREFKVYVIVKWLIDQIEFIE